MFVETYYDDRAAIPGSANDPVIPYPELLGEELTAWRKYLPTKRQVRNLYSRFETIPGPVITEIERAKRAPRLFDRIEIWSRTADPMAVGVIGEEKPRYFSIVRWGDEELTLEQVKERLRVEKVVGLIDCGRRDLVFSNCGVSYRGPWWIEVLSHNSENIAMLGATAHLPLQFREKLRSNTARQGFD